MKFTDGYWLYKEGVSAYGCADIRNVKITDKSVTLHITPFKVYNRGQTLGGPLFTLTFTSPQTGIINARFKHFENDNGYSTPSYVYNDGNCSLAPEETDENIIISSGDLSVSVNKTNKNDFKITYFYKGKYLTSSNEKQLAYIKAPRRKLYARTSWGFRR